MKALRGRAAAEAALAYIEAHPKSWDQGHFRSRCGSAYCFAGHVAYIGGYRWADKHDPWDDKALRFPGDRPVPVWQAAADILGLKVNPNLPGFMPFFKPSNRLADLRHLIEETWPKKARRVRKATR